MIYGPIIICYTLNSMSNVGLGESSRTMLKEVPQSRRFLQIQ